MEGVNKGNQKLLYKILKILKNGEIERIDNIKYKDGNIIENEKDIMKNWK